MSKELININIESICRSNKINIANKIKKAVTYYKFIGLKGIHFIFRMNKFIETCNHKEYIDCIDVKANYVTIAYHYNTSKIKTLTVIV